MVSAVDLERSEMSTSGRAQEERRLRDRFSAKLEAWKRAAQPFAERSFRFLAPAGAVLRRAWRPAALTALVLVSIFVLLPSSFYRPFSSGVDPHWHLALAVAFKKKWVFGRDVVFTYGPLGFLEGRCEMRGIKRALVAWDLSLYGVVGWVLYRTYARLETGVERVTALLHVIGIGIVHTAPGTQLIFPLELYFLTTHLNEKRHERLWLCLATLCAIVGLYVKVSTGMLGIAILALYLGYRIAANRPRSPYLVEAVVAAILLGVSFLLLRVAPIGYARGALELGSGYTAAMGSYDAHFAQWITVALFLVATLLVSVTIGARRLIRVRRRDELVQTLIVVAVVFVYFKQGFVRLDETHVLQFFRFAPLAAAFVYLYGETEVKRMLRPYLVCSVAVCVAQAFPGLALDRLEARYDEVWSYLAELEKLDDTAPATPRGAPRMPQSFVSKIGRASVDVVPHEVALAVQHPLRYTPRPVIQSYAAFTPYLDELDARFFRGGMAPEFVVYSHEALVAPEYAPWWSAPRTKLSLLERYEIVGAEGKHLLLALRAHPLSVRKGRKWTGTWQLGKVLPVPASSGIVLLSVRVHPTLRGRFKRLFYRPAALSLEVQGGLRRAVAAVVPAHLADGLLVNWFTDRHTDVKRLFAGDVSSLTSVERVRVTSDVTTQYRPDIEYEFDELVVADWGAKQTAGN